MICQNCGRRGQPEYQGRGSTALSIILFLFFIVPWVFYVLWCTFSTRYVCPSCKQPNTMVSEETPRGRKLAAEFAPDTKPLLEADVKATGFPLCWSCGENKAQQSYKGHPCCSKCLGML